MKKLFRNKNFFLLFQGTLVSNIGSSIYNFAVSWYILTLTGSPIAQGTYLATGAIIMLVLTPFCGVIADRFNKVRIVYLTDFIRGLAILAAGFVIFMDLTVTQSMIVLYFATIVLAVNGALFSPASGSLIPALVKEEDYQSANSAMSMINSIQGIIGLVLGGVLYGLLGVAWIFIINGLSFIISGISELFIKVTYQPKEDKLSITSGLVDLKQGVSYLFSRKGLLYMMGGFALLNFAVVPIMSNGFPVLFNQILQTDPTHYSMVGVGWSVGTLLGAIIIGNLAFKIRVFKSTLIGLVSLVVGFMVITFLMGQVINGNMGYYTFWYSIIGTMFIMGMINMYLNIPMNSAFMKTIEPEYRGRAFAVIGTMSQGAVPIAMFVGGYIVELRGIMAAAYFSITIIVIITIYLFMNKHVLRYLRSIDEVKEDTMEEETDDVNAVPEVA